jgi:hypothetical protein
MCSVVLALLGKLPPAVQFLRALEHNTDAWLAPGVGTHTLSKLVHTIYVLNWVVERMILSLDLTEAILSECDAVEQEQANKLPPCNDVPAELHELLLGVGKWVNPLFGKLSFNTWLKQNSIVHEFHCQSR